MKPWNEGGKEDTLDRMGISMSHDELAMSIGDDARRAILSAGYIIVPRQWRDDVVKALHELAEFRRRALAKEDK